jgi:type II restriction enzyme
MPPAILSVLDVENRSTKGLVERYIYLRFSERQQTVADVMAAIDSAAPKDFVLQNLLDLFVRHPGIRRSIDKAYEIVAYSLFETVVTALKATVKVRVPEERREMLKEFEELAHKLLGLQAGSTEWEERAHIFRVGVTNAADRGLDMWANFGPAVQVKHLSLDSGLAKRIVDQVESDHVVVVCKDADADVIQTITKQIGWGRRVRAIVSESDLIRWYEKCLRGKFAAQLGDVLLKHLSNGFKAEFPQNTQIHDFMKKRKYTELVPGGIWQAETDKTVAPKSH